MPHKKIDGFTIVELLIVIVVIAILAAITIVAFNGVTARADESGLKSSASQAAKALEIEKVTNGAYPADHESVNNGAGIQVAEGQSLQYTLLESGANYCLTVSSESRSFTISGSSRQAVSGACDGHTLAGSSGSGNSAPAPEVTLVQQNNAMCCSTQPRTFARYNSPPQEGNLLVLATRFGSTSPATTLDFVGQIQDWNLAVSVKAHQQQLLVYWKIADANEGTDSTFWFADMVTRARSNIIAEFSVEEPHTFSYESSSNATSGSQSVTSHSAGNLASTAAAALVLGFSSHDSNSYSNHTSSWTDDLSGVVYGAPYNGNISMARAAVSGSTAISPTVTWSVGAPVINSVSRFTVQE